MDKVEIVIKDACILFDLIDLEMLDKFYQLDLIVFTTLQVIEEITDKRQLNIVNGYIESSKLLIDEYGLYETIVLIYEDKPGLSYTDCSILELAIRKNATILSSDMSLRNESKRKNIPIKGILWILEELYLKGHINKDVLFEKLKLYPTINTWAPKAEIEKLVKKYLND